MDIEQIAIVCHQTNKSFCEQLDDLSQVDWEDAPQWQQGSAINGVRFRLKNPFSRPSESHNSWLKEKRETGWKYGPVKDADKKEHPCFVPYEQLPEAQKAKDALFCAVVDALKPLFK